MISTYAKFYVTVFPPKIHIYVIFDPSGITKKFNTVSLSTFSIEDSLCEVWWQTT